MATMLKFLRGNLVFGRSVGKRFMHSSAVCMQDMGIPYRGDYSQQAADARRQWVESVTKTSLSSLDGWWEPNDPFDEEHLIANIENSIGVIRIPVGVVGPIDIHGKYASGTFFVPASTTEGTLLASATRGAALLNKAGGVKAHAYRQRITRAPTLYCNSAEDAERVGGWIQSSLPILHEVVASVSKRAQLKSVDFFIEEEKLNLVFAYDSAEAAGQDMSSTCTKACCDWIVDNVKELDTKINGVMIENGLSGDKHTSTINALFGRGVSVVARASIPNSLIESVLKLKAEKLIGGIGRDHQLKAMPSSVVIGNVPNMIAAMFAAFGQDLGSVVECSQVFLNIQKGQYVGYVDVELKMPSLAIGTVGGGTALPTQSQCLAMVGCQGEPNSSRKLAEIIASVCLGAELSLLASNIKYRGLRTRKP
ncbi:3-hydroxy-3-methylglutaryl-coenzyme A reductase 2-like isoform X2 [Amphiura filiformis]|uniref:3-hydroxy-3-methylglutaryl-coenzyme A reductase 2-like isoform X2 n=1 Tax=Amphiura filiformis TaxID=82378 RepID=UPI003B211E67